MTKVTIYTDGACSGNPGPGGWAAILLCGDKKKELSGGEKQTTNNRMELLAVISALEALKKPCMVDLYSDSQYVVNAIRLGWLRSWQAAGWKRKGGPVMNVELWQRLLPLLQTHEVNFTWVKGHASNAYNNRCDELAVARRNEFAK